MLCNGVGDLGNENHIDDDDSWAEYKEGVEMRRNAMKKINRHLLTKRSLFICFIIFAGGLALVFLGGRSLINKNSEGIDDGTLLQYPPEIISETCSSSSISTREGWDECNKICNTASCCDIPIGTESSCLDKSFDVCQMYRSPCQTIRHSNHDSEGLEIDEKDKGYHDIVPHAPLDIAKICSTASMSTIDGFSKCEDVCQRAECCAASSSADNCLATNWDTCLQYAFYCSTINIMNVDITIVDKACKPYNLIKEDGLEKCRSICSPAACCFPDEFGDDVNNNNCNTTENVQLCHQFTPCKALSAIKLEDDSHMIGITQNDVTSLISEVCTDVEMFNSAGYKSCFDLCQTKQCCYTDDVFASCYESQKENCEGYKPCHILSIVDSITMHVDDFDKSSLVHEACMPDKISSNEGYYLCNKMCSERRCCFTFNETENCQADRPEWCDQFNQCKNLEYVVGLD